MSKTNFTELLEAGVHFGHLKRKWNPAMAPYIFMERNGIHIIDLQKTEAKLEEAGNALKQIAKSGRKILFVATKKQAKEIIAEKVKPSKMPYVTERWPGGMLTNFPTIRRAVKRMTTIDKMATDGTFKNLAKREKLQITRQRDKLERLLGSISDMNRLPAALFIVDVSKENIAVKEALKLNIPIFAIVDTNSNPTPIDFPIPANDDASKSISLVMEKVMEFVNEGLEERHMEKQKNASAKENKKSAKKDSKVKADPKKSSAKKTEKVETEKKEQAPSTEKKESVKAEKKEEK
ncbi:MAG: 30S ribosomal protein S2 [Bacteroidota bacterium]|nr:30S ribosomal protein S2 [Bacteroidota bacterium]